jgi:hypothetical protein
VSTNPGGVVATTTATTTVVERLLEPSYTFSVSATNAEGEGPAAVSDEVVIFTPSSISGLVTFQGVTSIEAVELIGSTWQYGGFDGPTPPPLNLPSNGVFSVTKLTPDLYFVSVSAPGFLRVSVFELQPGGTDLVLPDVELRAGLVNSDNVVDILDVSAIAASFGELVENRRDSQDRVVDLNADGAVTIRDISATVSNFGLTNPMAWPQ